MSGFDALFKQQYAPITIEGQPFQVGQISSRCFAVISEIAQSSALPEVAASSDAGPEMRAVGQVAFLREIVFDTLRDMHGNRVFEQIDRARLDEMPMRAQMEIAKLAIEHADLEGMMGGLGIDGGGAAKKKRPIRRQ